MSSPEEIKIINTENQENLYKGVIVDSLLDAAVTDTNKSIDVKGREKSLNDIKFAEEVQKEVVMEAAVKAQKQAKHNEEVTRAFESLQSAAVRYGSESQEKLEVIFSPETSTAMSFADARKWCKSRGGRLPTMAELRYAHSNKVEGFDDKTYWSSEEGLDNDATVLNFKNGFEGLMDKEIGIYVARATDVKH
jgi:hypothetical protein